MHSWDILFGFEISACFDFGNLWKSCLLMLVVGLIIKDCLFCFHTQLQHTCKLQSCEHTGQWSGLYPCQGEPGLLIAENTILATREKLLDDCKAPIVSVWLASGLVNVTEQSAMSSPTDWWTPNVISDGGQVTGTVGCRVTSVGGSDSFM